MLGEMDAATYIYSNVKSATGAHPSAIGVWVVEGSSILPGERGGRGNLLHRGP